MPSDTSAKFETKLLSNYPAAPGKVVSPLPVLDYLGTEIKMIVSVRSVDAQ